jgi:hypothetical protein
MVMPEIFYESPLVPRSTIRKAPKQNSELKSGIIGYEYWYNSWTISLQVGLPWEIAVNGHKTN